MGFNSLFKRMTFLVAILTYAVSGVQAQGTYLCNEKFSAKKPSGWDILPTHSATAPSWKPDTGICVSASYAMHGCVPYNNGDTATLVTPYFDCTNYEYVMIRFSHICKVLPSDICRIEYQEDVLGTANKWRPIPYDAYKGSAPYRQDTGFSHSSYSTWADYDTNATPTNGWWKQETFNMSDYAGYSKVRFRFIIRKGKYLGSFIAAGWYVDDFQVLVSKFELKPPVVQFMTDLSDTVYSAGPFTVKAKVASRTAAKIVNPYLAYSATYEGKTKKDSIRMKAVEGDSIWEAVIPQQYYGTEINYSIFGRDVNGNNSKATGSFINKRLAMGKVSGYTYYMPSDTTGVSNNNLAIIYHVGYATSLSRSLYLASEINPKNVPMTFSRLAWYLRSNSTNAGSVKVTRNLKIWMLATNDQTTQQAFMDPTTSGATLVYNDTTTSKVLWNEVVLQKPFVLPAGKNLYIFYEGCGGTTSSSSIYWAGHIQSSRCTYNYSGSWTASTMVPLIRLGMGGKSNFDSNSVALESIDNPIEGSIAGKQPVKVTIQNKGDDWLTSCQINWKVNGVLQTPVTWKGKLYTDFYDTLTLGSYIQRSMAYDTITVWVSSPNNKVDSVLDDDTLTVIAFGCDSLLKGNYTVGTGSQYNFATMSDALDIMEKCGLGGDMTLALSSGTYAENISLENINTNGKYKITITSIAGNRDSVIFRPKTGPVVSLNSCAGLIFKDLTFDATKAKPNCIKLGSILKDIEFRHCMIHGFDTAVSNNAFSTIYRASGSPIHNIRFIGNEIIGGSYGIYFYGSGTTARNSHILFDSNHVENYYSYAAYMYYNNNLKVTHNRFDGARSGNSYDYGFLSYYNDSSLFNANRFRNKALNSYVYGLRSYYTDSFTVISNNEIILKNTGTTTYGMYVYYTSGTKVVNNSILLNGSNTTTYGMYVYTGSTSYYADIHNNISVCLGTGSTAYPNYFTSTTAASRFNVDYNCWWSKANVGYVGGAKTTLAAFQSSLPSAVHDLYMQPVFVHSDTSALLKDNTGMLCPKVRGVDYDVNGRLRVAQTLRGAYTNEIPRMNGALNELVNLPGTTLITDTIHPSVVLMNAGTDTLREATIRVEIDHVVQGRDIVWKGQLATSETALVPLGTFMLKGGSHQFTAYLTGIGTLKDSIPADDTAKATTFTCAGTLAGSYTVGGTSPDFSTPEEAIKMLNLCGVTGPVTLKVRSGSYGAVSISGTVPGASSTNSITVIPENNAQVVIDGGAGTALSLHNSAHWHFRDLTFGNTKDGIIGVELQGQVEDVSFRHCNIYASTTATTTSYYAVYYPNSSGASSYPVDVEFVGNNIQGGYYNMYLYYLAGGTGNMTASSITVDSNILADAYYYGIYAYYYSHYKSMSHNTITNRKNSTNVYYGIYNYYYSNVDKMEGNRVHVVTTNTAYGIYWYYYKNYASYGGTAGKFTNNEIMVEGNGGTKYGLYFYLPYQNWEVSHNSIFAKSTSGAVYGIYAYNSNTSYNITMKNNLFVTEGTGTNYPIYAGAYYTSSYMTLDYNNYVSLNNTNIGYASSLITSLSNWKSSTGMDLHSVSIRPSFIDSTKNYELNDYMPFTCPRLSGVTTDINGKLRTATTTMGCYGFQIKEDVDLQAVAFIDPQPVSNAACLTTSVPVKVSVKNIGMKNADFSHSALKISLDVSGAISHHFDTTFTKGSLAIQQTDNFLLGSIPTLANGIYRIKVTLNDTSDTEPANDTMSMIYKVGRVGFPYDADFSTEPVEFVNATMSGNTGWVVAKGTGSNPALAPAFGTGRLEYAGEKEKSGYANAIFNGVDIQGRLNPTLSFWYAHNASCTSKDMLTVLVSTDGGANFTEVKRVMAADTVTAWRQYDVDLSAFAQASCLSVVFRATSDGGSNQSIDRIRISAQKDAALSLLPISTDNRTACDDTPVEVRAVITNLSRDEIDMTTDTLTLNVTGAISYSNRVACNRRLGGYASDTLTLGQIALDANGAYYLEAYMQSADDNSANDTLRDSSIFILQEIALDTLLGLDQQSLKPVGDTVGVSALVVNNGNTAVEQVILHMRINGSEVLADTVNRLLYPGDTLLHPMSQPYHVPAATREAPYYFFELFAELSCDADTSNNSVRMVGQVFIPDSIDLQVLEVTTTEQALGHTKLSPSVRIANIGSLRADSVVLHVDVVNDSNRVVESISETISRMEANETLNHDFTMTYEVPDYTGKYTLKAYVEAVDGDSIQSNDTLARQFRCYRDSVGIREVTDLDWQLGQNIPNPASEVTAIPFTLPQEGRVRLSVTTANGQVVYRQEIQGEAGGNRLELNTAEWASGIYYYTMEYREQRITKKLTVTR